MVGSVYRNPYSNPVQDVDSVDVYETEDPEPEPEPEPEPQFKVVNPMFPMGGSVMPGTIPPPVAPPVTPPKPDNSYAINYCDKREFPDEVLAQYGLERMDYFVFNTSCSHIFFQVCLGALLINNQVIFQCSIGQTFLLSCTSQDQAFDKSTENCNFKNAVKFCPEYDHVMHCSESYLIN